MFDRKVEKARQQEVFSREDPPLGRRVLTALLYSAGLSYRRIEPFVDRSYEAIKQWFHRLKHLFEPDCRARAEVAVDETTIVIGDEQHSAWAVDCDTLEGLAVDISPGRSSLDVLLVLEDVLERCRGRPLVRAAAGRGATGRSNTSTSSTKTWGTDTHRSVVRSIQVPNGHSWQRFSRRSTASSTRSWRRVFTTLHNTSL
jgi:putative transposase